MAKVVRINNGSGSYYYLVESFRVEGKSKKRYKYLGKILPKGLDKHKKEFAKEINSERWYPLFKKIKSNYKGELKRMPADAKDKLLEAFMVEFTYDTQRIEGSTLSFKDTAQ